MRSEINIPNYVTPTLVHSAGSAETSLPPGLDSEMRSPVDTLDYTKYVRMDCGGSITGS